MKTLLLALSSLLLSTTAFTKVEGQDKGNGGDICESRILEIRNDLKNWLKTEAPNELTLPKGLSVKKYRKLMLEQISSAKISCTDKTLKLGKANKTCLNFSNQGVAPFLNCNAKSFSETDESKQYRLIHHEFAGLAGFEVNNGNEESQYKISSQIEGFLEDTVVKKLSIKKKIVEPKQELVCNDGKNILKPISVQFRCTGNTELERNTVEELQNEVEKIAKDEDIPLGLAWHRCGAIGDLQKFQIKGKKYIVNTGTYMNQSNLRYLEYVNIKGENEKETATGEAYLNAAVATLNINIEEGYSEFVMECSYDRQN